MLNGRFTCAVAQIFLLFAVCFHVAPAIAQSALNIRIGFASPLTGPQAHYGQDNLNGARLALDELNARAIVVAGRPWRFELLVEDDQADPRTGPLVAQRLVDRGIHAIVGHFNSGVTIPASRVYHDGRVPQISVSTNPKYTRQGYDTTFRIMADDDKQGAALGEYAVRRLSIRRIAVVDDRSAYGQGLADAFAAAARAAGGQIVRREYTSDKDFDFRALLTALKSAKPEAIFFGGYDAQAGPLAKQMKELAFNATLLGGETMNTAKFLELAGSAAEGHVASAPGAALARRPRGTGFAERYRKRFGHEIGLYAPYFYDAVMVFADAMQKAQSPEPARYLRELRSIRHAGITADIRFEANGDLSEPLLSVFRVQQGIWVAQ
jgi:branched-chain amino acid transport system substrate-binding protein